MSRFLGDLRNWLHIGLGALALTVAAGAQNIWVANSGSATIATLNIGTSAVSQSPNLGGAVSGISISPDGSTAYASLTYGASVAVVNLTNNTLISTIPVGSTPGHSAVSPNGAYAYVINQASNSVSAISTASKSVVATIPVGSRPNSVTFSPDSSKAYVTNTWGGSVTVINTATNTVAATWPVGTTPTGVTVSPDGLKLYVTLQSPNSMVVLDANVGTNQGTITGFVYPVSVALTPDGAKAYVVNMSGTSVSVVNTATNAITGTIPVGSYPTWVAVSADGTQAYVTNEYGYSVSVINTATNTVTKTIQCGGYYPVVVAALPTIPGPTCTYQVSPSTPISFPQTGGSVTLNVTSSPSTCNWSVSGPAWVTLTPSATSGDGTVTVSVNANNTTTALSGTITIAGQSITIAEAGIVCTPTVNLTSGSLSFPVGGGTASFSVTAPNACTWSASGPAWASLTPSGTSGNGTVGVSVGANVGIQGLSGNITIAGQSFAVTEAGIVCNYTATLTGGSLSFPATGGTATITVVTQSPCTWSVSGAGWASVGQSVGQGSGTATVTAAANGTITPLSGTISVAGQSFAVTEAGITCTYSLSGTTSVPSGAGSGSITVTTPAGCAWSVTNNPAWVTIGSSVSSTGPGSVSYTYAANNSTNTRTGAFMIAGQELDVTQAAFVFNGIRVHAGGQAVTDANSNVWAADTPHNSVTTLSPVSGASSQSQPLYQTQAYASGPGLTYSFTVPNGTFTVTLLFAETYFSVAGERAMDISINGQLIDPAFDIVGRAGAANTAYSAVYSGVSVSNGQLTINLAPVNNGVATLAGIQIQ